MSFRIVACPLIACFCLTTFAAGQDAVARKRPDDVKPGADAAEVLRDVVYGKGGDVDLKLDIFLPKTRCAEPTPLVVFFHGGGWSKGNKESGSFFQPVTDEMLKRGYVCASVEYRLAPEHKWPAFMEDCKCAIRFFRANAAKYGIDPNRIGVYGNSAGGHIVSMLGTTDTDAGLEGSGGHADQSSRVQAVVNLFGPTDFAKMQGNRERANTVFGDDDEIYLLASPVKYVTKDDPPVLMLFGDKDALVAVEQGELFRDKLTEAGVENRLIVVEGGSHGLRDRDMKPAQPELVQTVCDFFDEHLRGK